MRERNRATNAAKVVTERPQLISIPEGIPLRRPPPVAPVKDRAGLQKVIAAQKAARDAQAAAAALATQKAAADEALAASEAAMARAAAEHGAKKAAQVACREEKRRISIALGQKKMEAQAMTREAEAAAVAAAALEGLSAEAAKGVAELRKAEAKLEEKQAEIDLLNNESEQAEMEMAQLREQHILDEAALDEMRAALDAKAAAFSTSEDEIKELQERIELTSKVHADELDMHKRQNALLVKLISDSAPSEQSSTAPAATATPTALAPTLAPSLASITDSLPDDIMRPGLIGDGAIVGFDGQVVYDPTNGQIGSGGFGTVYAGKVIPEQTRLELERARTSDKVGSAAEYMRLYGNLAKDICLRARRTVALKTIADAESFAREHDALMLLKERAKAKGEQWPRFVVPVLARCFEKKILLSPFYARGDLCTYKWEYRKQGIDMPIAECLGFFTDAMTGVAEMHRLGMVHRDIKPENVLLEQQSIINGTFVDGTFVATRLRAVIADLGLASCASVPNVECAGTPYDGRVPFAIISAFEHAQEDLVTKEMNYPADVWAAGCLFHQLVTLKAVNWVRGGDDSDVLWEDLLDILDVGYNYYDRTHEHLTHQYDVVFVKTLLEGMLPRELERSLTAEQVLDCH